MKKLQIGDLPSLKFGVTGAKTRIRNETTQGQKTTSLFCYSSFVETNSSFTNSRTTGSYVLFLRLHLPFDIMVKLELSIEAKNLKNVAGAFKVRVEEDSAL